jgi:uncharacterized membrane protein HdeD (DUF308 family)
MTETPAPATGDTSSGWSLVLALGVTTALFGLLILAWPEATIGFVFLAVPEVSRVVLVATTGVGAIVVGAGEMVMANHIRRSREPE